MPEGDRTHVPLEVERAFRRDGCLSLALWTGVRPMRAIASELERLIRRWLSCRPQAVAAATSHKGYCGLRHRF
ncbi:hypothetical protein [uncultured Azohydromonas sp.]|uniref:hypothetical protein n=1 Tax=uncultured Azohydromonas sp. TaxID=487342 RepID=UPI0026089762|nr:hypothetical protein [uncultured Azohydromonas sp.]